MGSLSGEQGVTVRDIVSHVDRGERDISLVRQSELLGIARSSIYYQPVPIDLHTVDLMHRIDEIYTDYPFYGSRKMAEELSDQLGRRINRKCTQRLMREMGLEAIYPKPNLSRNDGEHLRYPYLLTGVTASRPNHIWGTDITYIRLKSGFCYLTAFLDWYSRYVLSWRLSITLEAKFCIEAASEALSIGIPEITNSDQGVQYTSNEYGNVWKPYDVKMSMDSRGRAMDNIFTERLWRSVKYEEVYLKSYESVWEAKEGIGRYLNFYNNRRKHQSLGYKTPAEIYFERR